MVKNLTLLDRQNITYIPDGTWLTLTIEGQELAQKSVFVGLKNEEYMVVTAPVDDADGERDQGVSRVLFAELSTGFEENGHQRAKQPSRSGHFLRKTCHESSGLAHRSLSADEPIPHRRRFCVV